MFRAIFVLLSLFVLSQQRTTNFLLGLGDSYTALGGNQSFPLVAGRILNWTARDFAVGGSKMNAISSQLARAASILPNVTHIVLTTSGNDLGVKDALMEVIVDNNATGVEQKIQSLQAELITTYKTIKTTARPGTKIYGIPYVDFISVGHKIPNEDQCHQVLQVFSDMVKGAASQAGIGFIEDVKGCFLGHEMYSADPYSNGLTGRDAAHPNLKGYNKIGQVVAAYLQSHQ